MNGYSRAALVIFYWLLCVPPCRGLLHCLTRKVCSYRWIAR